MDSAYPGEGRRLGANLAVFERNRSYLGEQFSATGCQLLASSVLEAAREHARGLETLNRC